MKARRILIAAMWINLIGVTATAETMVVRPDMCASSANAPRIISLGEPDAGFRQRDPADDVLVLYAVPQDGWASARLLTRFSLQGERMRFARGARCRAED